MSKIDAILLKHGSKSFEDAFNKLAEHPLNNDVEDKKAAFNQGESWQLMSVIVKDNDLNNALASFRHRCFPLDNERRDVTFFCVIDEADIEIRRQIK